MLKVDINAEQGNGSIEFSGSLANAVADATFAVRDMYRHFSEKEPLLGTLFQLGIQAIIVDDDSPVWRHNEKEKDGIKSVEIKLPDGFQIPGDE